MRLEEAVEHAQDERLNEERHTGGATRGGVMATPRPLGLGFPPMPIVFYRATPWLRSIQGLSIEVVIFVVGGLAAAAAVEPHLARLMPEEIASDLLLAVGVLAFVSYQVTLPLLWGATPARRLLGVRFESTAGDALGLGQMIRRFAIELVETALLAVGGPVTMIALFIYRKQQSGWPHEVIAGTRTVWASRRSS